MLSAFGTFTGSWRWMHALELRRNEREQCAAGNICLGPRLSGQSLRFRPPRSGRRPRRTRSDPKEPRRAANIKKLSLVQAGQLRNSGHASAPLLDPYGVIAGIRAVGRTRANLVQTKIVGSGVKLPQRRLTEARVLEHQRTARAAIPGERGAAAAVVLFTGLTIATLLRIGTVGGALEKHAFPYIASFLGASVIWLCALLNRSIEQRSQFRELGAFFGRVSYPVYLFHLPILMILAQWTNGVAPLAEFAIYLCLLIFFCAVFHAIFEKPILAARPRYKRDS